MTLEMLATITAGNIRVATKAIWGDKSRLVTLSDEEGQAVNEYLTGVVLITGEDWETVKDTYHRALVEYPWWSPVRQAKTLYFHAWLTGKLFDEWDCTPGVQERTDETNKAG